LKWKKKRVYLWTHGVTSSKKGLKWKIRKFFYGLSDGLMLYGKKAKEIMAENGYPKEKLHVIFNSLDYQKQKELRTKFNEKEISRLRHELFKNPELPLIVFVGRLTPQKKLTMLIEASSLLKNRGLQINTLFVGGGSEREHLEILARDYGLSSIIHFYGPCYDEEELSQLIGAADLCVSPGEVGLTALTALGYGTPVISHSDFDNQMPEYEAIIPGFNGDLFEFGSISDLVEKISNWIDLNKDVPREEIRRRCFKIVDDLYNPQNQAKIIESILLNE
jgi:glycosyltransferase involved in cell wall biosynthesis